MNKNRITTKQVCALFLCLLPLTKIVCAPSVISGLYGEKLWQPLVFWLLIELAFIAYVFYLTKKHGNKTVFEILSDGYGETFAKTIFFIYGFYFLLKAFLPIIEHKMLIESAFYEILPSTPVFYPLFLITFYTSLKGLKTLGRAAQFCLPICWAGLATILFLSVSSGDWSTLLPVFYGSKNGAIELLSTISWFDDALYLLFFMGHFKKDGHDKLRIILSYTLPFLFTIAFFLCFYAVFSYVAPSQLIAVKETGIFSVTLQNVGRFDYLAMFLIALASVLAAAFPAVTSVKMFERASGARKALYPAAVVNLALLAATILLSQKYREIAAIYTNYLSPFFAVCGYILPLFALRRSKKNERLQKS